MPDAIDNLLAELPDVLGPSGVSKALGVTTRTVYSWLNGGTIRGYQLGSTWFILKDDLVEHLRAGANRKDD